MDNFKITLNNDQIKALESLGFYGLAEDSDNLLFYIHSVIEWLESHNKNYTKAQYERIVIINDIFQALYKNF